MLTANLLHRTYPSLSLFALHSTLDLDIMPLLLQGENLSNVRR